ncbi:class I SAM-dependent methyltransferase [Kitasatospora sp. NA04385]|uniref:class I SAM-dependent methyltransferase n=1 Tax=Kitasatospora sp. NA04385 TaxID=2742135 RepID=UPI001591A4EC|nr:methyltransferase domain-containing protein [Kitasatospora sp. NA04385]QKW23929.1 class I SAM-dependent methyltransferase [Kitasatospora sp. NA04385]
MRRAPAGRRSNGPAAPEPVRFSGVREVVRYNWPLYAAGCLAAGAGLALARRLPGPAATLARAGAGAAAALLTSSTAATWWVYDRSELRTFDWLEELLPTGPGEHLVLSSGLDEASRPVATRWPHHPQTVVDLYDPALMTEGSIRRARHHVPPAPRTRPGRHDRLPAATASADTVLAVFAAHELRRAADRHGLFAECARVLRPGGRLVLVEHLRDAANTAVYGPGAQHFFSRRTWLRAADGAGLHLVAQRRIGGLVTALVLAAPTDTAPTDTAPPVASPPVTTPTGKHPAP